VSRPGRAASGTLRLVAVAAGLAALDQAAKAMVRAALSPGEPIEVVDGVLAIVLSPNYRGVSSWLPDVPAWFPGAVTALLVLILLGAFPVHRFHARYRRDTRAAALAAVLMAASAAGHLLDDLFAPFTTDWIRLLGAPAFNLADLYAYAGLVCIAIELRRNWRDDRGMSLGERFARARETRRRFLRFRW
jgi:lipoprotein signal peptidase